MKKLILTFAIALFALAVTAQESFTDRFGGMKGVTSVYISKSLLGMMPDMKSNGKNFGAVAGKLDNMQILNTETPKAARTLKEECGKIIRNGKYVSLMNINDDGEHTGIYMKEFVNGKKQYVMLSVDKDETSVIVLTGKLTLQDIKNVMKR